MSEQDKSNLILQPPRPGMKTDSPEFYSMIYELWNRSGGYKQATSNLNGLKASVAELNTLVKIRTDDTVQDQLDSKVGSNDVGTMAAQDADSVAITGGSIGGVAISDSNITLPVGDTSEDAAVGGTLNVDTASVGNIGVGEDALITYTLIANSLNNDFDYLDINAWGITAANANNKTIKLKIGTTTILDTGAVAANGASWWINCRIIRTGAATQQIIASIISDSALIVNSSDYTDGVEDLSGDLDIFCTGDATANDDIVQKGLLIKWFRGV